jgi:IS30 family transposase
MPQRTALAEIDVNRSKYRELKLTDRASIIAASKCGVSIAKTIQRLSFNPNTIKTTLRRDSIGQNNEALPRSSRPSKVSKRDI